MKRPATTLLETIRLTATSTTTSPSLDPTLYLAIDIETTGGFIGSDKCLALGWASGTHQDFRDDKLTTGKIVVDLGKPEEVTWKDYWKSQGFEQRCYDQFWADELPILDGLQALCKSGSDGPTDKLKIVGPSEELATQENAFSTLLDNLLAGVEDIATKRGIKCKLVSDTTCYDTAWLYYLLTKYGKLAPQYTRKGKYNGDGIETGSLQRGLYRTTLPLEKPWEKDEEFMKHVSPIHDHDPQNDALQILTTLFACKEKALSFLATTQ